VEELAGQAGLQILQAILEEEVSRRVGPPHRPNPTLALRLPQTCDWTCALCSDSGGHSLMTECPTFGLNTSLGVKPRERNVLGGGTL
jgi:hypothetical protein